MQLKKHNLNESKGIHRMDSILDEIMAGDTKNTNHLKKKEIQKELALINQNKFQKSKRNLNVRSMQYLNTENNKEQDPYQMPSIDPGATGTFYKKNRSFALNSNVSF